MVKLVKESIAFAKVEHNGYFGNTDDSCATKNDFLWMANGNIAANRRMAR